MSRLASVAAILMILSLAMGFASLNGSQRVTVRLGFTTLTVVAFGGLLTGMVIMLAAGIRSDLKVRRILRDRLAAEDRDEKIRFIDRHQAELFAGGEEEN